MYFPDEIAIRELKSCHRTRDLNALPRDAALYDFGVMMAYQLNGDNRIENSIDYISQISVRVCACKVLRRPIYICGN